MAKSKKAFSFAHLLGRAGFGATDDSDNTGDSGGGDQDDERKQRDDESDDEYAQRMEELDKKEKDGGEDDAGAEDDGDDADAEEPRESDKEKAARARERARCAAIFGSKAAGGRPDVAAHLAFNTSMSAREAIGLLGTFAAGTPAAAPAASRTSLATRMQGVPAQNVGASSAASPAGTSQGAAAMIIAAGKKRRGEA